MQALFRCCVYPNQDQLGPPHSLAQFPVSSCGSTNARCMKPPYILSKNVFIKAVVFVKRCGDGSPHAMQIIMGQTLKHRNRHGYYRCSADNDSSSAARDCATRCTTSRLAPLSGWMGGRGSPTASPSPF